MRKAIRSYHWQTETGAGEPDAGAVLARLVWPEVLARIPAGSGKTDLEYDLLTCLLITRGWQLLFAQPDTARAFVVRAIRYIEPGADSNVIFAEALAVRLVYAVTKWLTPVIVEDSMRGVASALFGEVWCNLVYDSHGENESLAGLIEFTQPEFLPGRLTTHAQQQSTPLPDLTCASA